MRDAEAPEVTAWVVIQPDDSVVIRVARAEMGQGVLTGLAMLVAEELECDWSKVRTEFVSAGENLRRDQSLGRYVDRRQPLDRRFAALSAASRRHGAGNADRCRRGAMECARRGMRRSHEQDYARAERPKVTFGAVAEDAAKITIARGRRAEGSQPVDARGNAAPAS